MDSGKIRRTTTRKQFKEMVEQMKNQPDIAKNITTKQSPELQQFWENLAETLNTLGPPFKEISEWKKVWSDFKSSLRKKLSNNKRASAEETEEQIFTSLEEEVIQLVCLRDCVEGVPQTRSFGIPRKRKFDDASASEEKPLFEDIQPIEVVEVVTEEYNGTHEDEENNCRNLPDIVTHKRRNTETGKPPSISQLMLNQTGIQKKLYEKMSAFLTQNIYQTQEINANFQKISLALNRIGEQEAKHNDILQALLDETKRHNKKMEKLALDKEAFLSGRTSE